MKRTPENADQSGKYWIRSRRSVWQLRSSLFFL